MAGSLTIAAIGLLLSAYADSLTGKVVCLAIAASGIWGAIQLETNTFHAPEDRIPR